MAGPPAPSTPTARRSPSCSSGRQAKLEAPLKALRNSGGAIIISTIAEITFYGTDQNGNTVSVMGRIGVNFADWGDPDA